jgi:hypothetical protein
MNRRPTLRVIPELPQDRGRTMPTTPIEAHGGRSDGFLITYVVGANVVFLLPYLWLLACGYEGGRGSSAAVLLLVPALLGQVLVVVIPSLHGVRRRELTGTAKRVAWITTIVSLLVGTAAAILCWINETGC